jgi:hypothetical protein
MMLGTLIPVAFVWWLGGVVLLVWLAAMSIWDYLERSKSIGAPTPGAPGPEYRDEEEAVLAVSRVATNHPASARR